jgi:hypothetical protein
MIAASFIFFRTELRRLTIIVERVFRLPPQKFSTTKIKTFPCLESCAPSPSYCPNLINDTAFGVASFYRHAKSVVGLLERVEISAPVQIGPSVCGMWDERGVVLRCVSALCAGLEATKVGPLGRQTLTLWAVQNNVSFLTSRRRCSSTVEQLICNQ